jgi:outer membrane biosynthesis protein TonB
MSRRNRNIFIAIIISLLFHIGLIFFIEFFDWLVVNTQLMAENIPDEITVVFPENKPTPVQSEEQKYIVENQNETNEIPEKSNLLSERNSRARNPELASQFRENTPLSQGNIDNRELSNPLTENKPMRTFKKPFSSDALTGKHAEPNNERSRQQDKDENEEQSQQQASLGNNQRFNQKDFSVEEVGALSLSTYAWEWAPYINKLKIKHQRVWSAPPAYSQLGLISGQTRIVFEIARDGSLISAQVIDHKGHESLEVSSLESIKAIFPFYPLPDDFPNESLTITATLIYPDLRKLYNERRR